jgi:hypothetical protein
MPLREGCVIGVPIAPLGFHAGKKNGSAASELRRLDQERRFDVHEKSRSYRKRLRHAGIKVAAKGRPLPGTIASGWKHRMDGGWERRAAR